MVVEGYGQVQFVGYDFQCLCYFGLFQCVQFVEIGMVDYGFVCIEGDGFEYVLFGMDVVVELDFDVFVYCFDDCWQCVDG